MGLFDKLLGTTASANSIGAATQGVTHTGDYYVTQSSAVMAAQQRHALMNAVHTQSQDGRPEHPFDPDNAAWSASISTIVDLWLAKFGDSWVEEKDLFDDTFFAIVATRLLKTNRLEKHTVPTNFFSVYRIVE
jgi:hypothetical protein